MPRAHGIARQPLRDQVYDLVKNRIMNMNYEFGERINLRAIAKELNISVTPVREAISVLEREGLVTLGPFSAPHVVKFDSEIFRNIWMIAVSGDAVGGYELCVEMGRLPPAHQSDVREHRLSREIADTADRRLIITSRAVIAVDTSIIETLQQQPPQLHLPDTFDNPVPHGLSRYHHTIRTRMTNIRDHDIILSAISARQHASVRRLMKPAL
jgi:DNA-binding GntR family transcriptional regulator